MSLWVCHGATQDLSFPSCKTGEPICDWLCALIFGVLPSLPQISPFERLKMPDGPSLQSLTLLVGFLGQQQQQTLGTC